MRYILILILVAKITLAQGGIIWQKLNTELPANGFSWSTPLIMDHKLFWAGQDKAFAALDEITGSIIWIDSVNFPLGTYDSPVGFEGKVFISKGDAWSDPGQNALYALDAETGNIVWQKPGLTIFNRSSKPIHTSHETIFIASTDTLYCLNINDGSVVWKKDGLFSNLLIDNSGTRLFASRRESAMVEVLNPLNGEQFWYLTLPDDENFIHGMAFTSSIIKDYLILAPDWNWNVDTQYVYCIDVQTKEIIWRTDKIGHTGNGASPVIMDLMVFAGTQKSSSDTSQNIVAFNLSDGNIVWEKPVRGSGATNTPYVIALDGKVYYEYNMNNDYFVVCADAATGTEIWKSKPEGSFEWWPISWGSPLLYNNRLFMPTDGGGIYCYDAGQVNGSWLMVSGNVNATNSYSPDLITKVEKDENVIPSEYNLEQNFPNPFNPSTNISFVIPEEGFVKLSIYNSIGERVAVLVNNNLSAGKYIKDFNGEKLSSGIYFYSLEVNSKIITKKMMLLK
ncbi:MAG: PQQ-binding-like beta-propeller repeat protein [Bacteroidetes bacterium]|nr:PQQ-binding-like beta-propeller repeat protein [Bacteroidota bacterium]